MFNSPIYILCLIDLIYRYDYWCRYILPFIFKFLRVFFNPTEEEHCEMEERKMDRQLKKEIQKNEKKPEFVINKPVEIDKNEDEDDFYDIEMIWSSSL